MGAVDNTTIQKDDKTTEISTIVGDIETAYNYNHVVRNNDENQTNNNDTISTNDTNLDHGNLITIVTDHNIVKDQQDTKSTTATNLNTEGFTGVSNATATTYNNDDKIKNVTVVRNDEAIKSTTNQATSQPPASNTHEVPQKQQQQQHPQAQVRKITIKIAIPSLVFLF